MDALFGGGTASRKVVLEATAACMIAWFTQQLRGAAGGGSSRPQTDPLSLAATAIGARAPVMAAAAVYGEMAAQRQRGGVGGGGEDGGDGFGAGGGSTQLPLELTPLGNLIEAGELTFHAKGGACTAHPL